MKEKIKLIGIFTIIALVFSIPVVYACHGNGGNFVGGQSRAMQGKSICAMHKEQGQKAKRAYHSRGETNKDCGCE